MNLQNFIDFHLNSIIIINLKIIGFIYFFFINFNMYVFKIVIIINFIIIIIIVKHYFIVIIKDFKLLVKEIL